MIEPRGLSSELRTTLASWANENELLLLVHFGSGAPKGSATLRGDVDLAIWLDPLPTPARRLAIIGELQDLVEPRAVDAVFLHRDTDPVLRYEIFRTGEPLHEAREGMFVHQVVRAVALYEDALPFRRALEESLRAGGGG